MVTLGIVLLANAAFAEIIHVPATANPWLAGMANGSTARRGDTAPEQSPMEITNTAITGVPSMYFQLPGRRTTAPRFRSSRPTAKTISPRIFSARKTGSPTLRCPTPASLEFFWIQARPTRRPRRHRSISEPPKRDTLALKPALKQPFFIGNGTTSSGIAKQIVAPTGATRLLFGIMDEYNWADNEGAFTVEVTRASSASLVKLMLFPSSKPHRCGCRCLSLDVGF